jgi:hypothetical protein
MQGGPRQRARFWPRPRPNNNRCSTRSSSTASVLLTPTKLILSELLLPARRRSLPRTLPPAFGSIIPTLAASSPAPRNARRPSLGSLALAHGPPHVNCAPPRANLESSGSTSGSCVKESACRLLYKLAHDFALTAIIHTPRTGWFRPIRCETTTRTWAYLRLVRPTTSRRRSASSPSSTIRTATQAAKTSTKLNFRSSKRPMRFSLTLSGDSSMISTGRSRLFATGRLPLLAMPTPASLPPRVTTLLHRVERLTEPRHHHDLPRLGHKLPPPPLLKMEPTASQTSRDHRRPPNDQILGKMRMLGETCSMRGSA